MSNDKSDGDIFSHPAYHDNNINKLRLLPTNFNSKTYNKLVMVLPQSPYSIMTLESPIHNYTQMSGLISCPPTCACHRNQYKKVTEPNYIKPVKKKQDVKPDDLDIEIFKFNLKIIEINSNRKLQYLQRQRQKMDQNI